MKGHLSPVEAGQQWQAESLGELVMPEVSSQNIKQKQGRVEAPTAIGICEKLSAWRQVHEQEGLVVAMEAIPSVRSLLKELGYAKPAEQINFLSSLSAGEQDKAGAEYFRDVLGTRGFTSRMMGVLEQYYAQSLLVQHRMIEAVRAELAIMDVKDPCAQVDTIKDLALCMPDAKSDFEELAELLGPTGIKKRCSEMLRTRSYHTLREQQLIDEAIKAEKNALGRE